MADVSDTLNFFDAFDIVIQHHKASLVTNKKRSSKEGVVNKVLLFKDLLTIDGNFKKPLFAFLAWVISNNEREIYLAKKCNMKFLHSQGKLSLLRVAIHLDSTCLVTKNSTDWVLKCLIGWKKHCFQLGSQSEINHAELMLASLGADPIKPQASFVLPPGADLSVIDVRELDNKGKGHAQVQCQLDERVELAETNVQIAQDIIQLNAQANQVEDRIIERFTGLFAKIEEDLHIEISNISQDLQQLQFFHTKISGTDSEDNQDLDRAILESMTSNYDEQNRLQKEIEKMKAYYSNLVKSKNAEMESLIRELSGKDHYMSTALSFNSSLAVTKTALEDATTTPSNPNRISSHSTSFRILSPSGGNADQSPAVNLVQSPTSVKSPSIRSPPPNMKRSKSFFNQSFEKNVESDEVLADFSTKELCDYYEIDSLCIFEGGTNVSMLCVNSIITYMPFDFTQKK